MDKKFSRALQQPINALTILLAVSFCFFVVSLIGSLVNDNALIHQEHWIKLTKFSLSFCAYAITLSWLGNNFFKRRKLFAWSARLACLGAIVELAVLYGQALASIYPLLNTELFQNTTTLILRIAIIPVTSLIAVTFFLVLKDKTTSPVLRSGLLWATSLVLIGCIPAILMLVHSDAIANLSSRHSGIPFFGWSTTNGDLRIAHFVGVHALQVMPAVAWLALKCGHRLSVQQQLRLVSNVGFLLLSLIILLTAQALIGESFFAQNVFTLSAVALCSTMLFLIGRPIYVSFCLPAKSTPFPNCAGRY